MLSWDSVRGTLGCPARTVAMPFTAASCEGFTDIQYVELGTTHGPNVVAAGGADLSMWDTPGTIPALDSGKVVILGGVHAGCIEVFGNERVRSIRDIKGKTLAIG